MRPRERVSEKSQADPREVACAYVTRPVLGSHDMEVAAVPVCIIKNNLRTLNALPKL